MKYIGLYSPGSILLTENYYPQPKSKMATIMKFKMAAKSKMATNTKFKMVATVARQQEHNNTTRTGPFQETKFATLSTVTFVDFYTIIMQYFALFQHL